ncbi:MAG: hypothetical protein B7X00_01295 [Legionella sp. 21-45-4]|nr:MAG: hypothetical protein B7X00_01295 [Legionella sp. 21-45-4]
MEVEVSMSERLQINAAWMAEHMNVRYPEGHSHKHDKRHLEYRRHQPSHPTQLTNLHREYHAEHQPEGWVNSLSLQKTRDRLIRRTYH